MSLSPESRVHHDRMHLVWDTLLKPRMLDWRDAIDVHVPFARMDETGMSRREISDCITYITGTYAQETTETYLNEAGVRYKARGYRLGPAGDH